MNIKRDRSRRIIVSFLWVLVPGCASTKFDAQPALTKAEIVEKAFSLYGGRTPYLALESLTQASRVITSNGERTFDLPFRLEFSRPDRIRLETETPDGRKLVQIYANGKARQWVEGVEQPPGQLASRFQRRLEYIFILALLINVPLEDIVLVGTPEVADRPTYALEIPRENSVVTMFFDQQNFQLRRIRESLIIGDETQVQDVYLDQYKLVDGRPMPWRFVTLVNDQKVSEAQMIEAEIGIAIPNERFEGLSSPSTPNG